MQGRNNMTWGSPVKKGRGIEKIVPQEQETLQRVKGVGAPSHGEGGQPVCLQRLQGRVGSWTWISPEPGCWIWVMTKTHSFILTHTQKPPQLFCTFQLPLWTGFFLSPPEQDKASPSKVQSPRTASFVCSLGPPLSSLQAALT